MNLIRRKLGYGYWSPTGCLKRKVKKAIRFIEDREASMIQAALKRGANGVVCGHIHRPEIRVQDGIDCCNTGDRVENCTALVEHFDGRLELINWVTENNYRENDLDRIHFDSIAADLEAEHVW